MLNINKNNIRVPVFNLIFLRILNTFFSLLNLDFQYKQPLVIIFKLIYLKKYKFIFTLLNNCSLILTWIILKQTRQEKRKELHFTFTILALLIWSFCMTSRIQLVKITLIVHLSWQLDQSSLCCVCVCMWLKI